MPIRAFRPDLVPRAWDSGEATVSCAVPAALHSGRPLDLEIGCGVGWHPIHYASVHPERFLIAIERTTEKFEKFATRLKHHFELANLIPVHADAVAWVVHHLPDASLDRIFILYPNPSAKNSQARWIRMPFFGHLLTKLKSEGAIEIRTNIAAYADEIRTYAQEVWQLRLIKDERIAAPVSGRTLSTHFEQKYLARGENCFRIVLARR